MKITIAYTHEAELHEVLKRLRPLIGRTKGPYKPEKSKYTWVHITTKSAYKNSEYPQI